MNPHFARKTVFSHSGIARIVLQTLGFQKLTLVTHGGHEALDDEEKLDTGFVVSSKQRYLRYVLWNTLLGEAGCVVSPSSQTHSHVDFAPQFAAIQSTRSDSNRRCEWFRNCRPGRILR